MTIPDTQILSVVQIALIGILVVIGMFLMWRKIQRLEQKIEMFMATCESSQCFASGPHDSKCMFTPDTNQRDTLDQEEDMDEGAEEELMKTLFQDGGSLEDATTAFMVFTPYGFNGGSVSSGTPPVSVPPASSQVAHVQIEEVVSSPDKKDSHHQQEQEQDHDGMSEVPTEKGGLTRTKISRMNVDRLKELLQQQSLSTEGTRKQLMDRLIEKLQL